MRGVNAIETGSRVGNIILRERMTDTGVSVLVEFCEVKSVGEFCPSIGKSRGKRVIVGIRG